VVSGTNAAEAVTAIKAAEDAGVRQVWTTQTMTLPDTLTMFAAAAAQTKSIRVGTAIVPVYPQHPLVLARQALALHDLAPGRLRLGVGTSHRRTVEGVYGLPMESPLEYLHEYVEVLRAALWDGKVDHQGRFLKAKVELPRTPRTPILISALREGAFRLAGRISDGAISWVCPVPYLLDKALPALRAGAEDSNRPAPPLLAHVPVALSNDREAVTAAARKRLGIYGRLPYYAAMFEAAGYAVSPEGGLTGDLIDNLVVRGDEASVAQRLSELLGTGLDELLIMLVPVGDADAEQSKLMHLIGQLS
jgi:F420-dependent oxidoreductase-like protein